MTCIDRLVAWYRRLGRSLQVTDAAGVSGRVTVREYRLADARARWPDWHRYDRETRRQHLADLEPAAEHQTHNVVVDDYLQHVVDLADQSQDVTVEDITHFAVGTGTTSPSTSDSSLGNEVARDTIDTEDDQGKDLAIQGFLDSGQANGNTLEETGLFTGTSGGSTIMVNRALITSTDKTSDKLITVDYTLKYRNS